MSKRTTTLPAPLPEDGHDGQVTWSRCQCEWHRAALRFGQTRLEDSAHVPSLWERLTWAWSGQSVGAWWGHGDRPLRKEG